MHVQCMYRSQNKVLGISVFVTLFFESFLYYGSYGTAVNNSVTNYACCELADVLESHYYAKLGMVIATI